LFYLMRNSEFVPPASPEDPISNTNRLRTSINSVAQLERPPGNAITTNISSATKPL
jgi:hypothetical protein